jgi:hypothetical protein
MFRAIPFILALTMACSSSTPDEPEAQAVQAERSAPPGAMGKKSKGKSPRGKKPTKSAKGKQAPSRTKAGGAKAAKAGGAKGAPEAIGVSGKISGVLSLDQSGEGEKTLTRASLKLSWEGGDKDLPLGEVKGTCTDAAVTPIKAGEQEVTPLWAVDCTAATGGHDARIAIVQSDTTLSVRRAKVEGETLSAWRMIKRLRLVEGASVERSDTPAAPADAASD